MAAHSTISSCGFQPYSYRDFIKQLRQLLQDRYTWDGDGFTILKELIQNANDAGATSLHLGWSPPLFDAASSFGAPNSTQRDTANRAPHSLLTVPALFAVNNGPLRKSDAINITRLGSNSKAGEASSAGRFGLGLKSVFHLCEAFFYLAKPFEEHESLCSIFNPWSPSTGTEEAGPYPNWDFSPDDAVAVEIEAAIQRRLKPIYDTTSPLFCLWIPLRDKRVLKGDGLVKRELTGKDLGQLLEDSSLHLRLAELLPLLHCLSEIRVWCPNTKGAVDERIAVTADAASTRPPKLPELIDNNLPAARQTEFAGSVSVSRIGNPAPQSCCFVGSEAILTSQSIQSLWRNPNWPPDESLDPETNEWREHRVTLIPHGALRFMAVPKATGQRKVSLHWCVFLPLGRSDGDEHLEVDAHLDVDVSVFLHGYFFIDAGRTRHVKTVSEANHAQPQDVEGLQKEWNATLEREAIWPQFVEAFATFVSRVGWAERQVKELTRAVCELLRRTATGSSSLWATICRSKQWLFLLKPPTEGTKSLGSWTLKTANAVVHEIPPADGIAFFDVLPGLGSVGTNHAVTFADWPRLAAAQATPWSATLLRKVIESLNPEVAFKTAVNLAYLARFLEHCATSDDQKNAVGEALWLILKKAFKAESITLKSLEEKSDDLRRVLEFVPEEHRLVLAWASSERRGTEAAFRLIAKDDCDLLPIPFSVRPERGRDCKKMESTVVVRLLRALADEPLDNALLADVVSDFFRRADLDRDSLLHRLKDVPLLMIYDCQRKQWSRQTWDEFTEHRVVFCDQAGLTQHLQAALGDAACVWRLDPDFAGKVLGEKHGLSGCSARECAAVLATPRHGNANHLSGEDIGPWDARKALMEKLTDSLGKGMPEDQEKIKDACRLLLHGRPQDADFNPALFLATDGPTNSLAMKLVRHVLTKRQEEWRILSGEHAAWALKDGLTVTQRDQLSLYPLTLSEPAVLDLLQKANADHLSGLDVSSDEYVELLTKIDFTRNDLLRRLPIHPVVGTKQRIAIPTDNEPPRVLWDDGYPLDGDLTQSITLLKLIKQVEARQRQLASVLNHEQALQMALSSEHPDKHWKTIFAAIVKAEAVPPDDSVRKLKIIADLKSKKWFPTRFGAKSRNDLICLTLSAVNGAPGLPVEFQQQVTRLAEDWEGAYVPDWMMEETFHQDLRRKQEALKRLIDWQILPDESESLRRLGALLAEDEKNQIGHVPLIEKLFEDWLAIDWDSHVMPAHRLLKAINGRFGIDRCFDPASNAVRVPITSNARLIAILNFLVSHLEQATTRDNRERSLRLHRKYLEFLLDVPDFTAKSMLRDLRLLSAAGSWKRSAELCLPPVDGIAPDNVLEDGLTELLRRWCAASDKTMGSSHSTKQSAVDDQLQPSSIEQSADVVADYFREWEGHVPNDVIGGFVGLLGGDSKMEEVASRYLGKRSLDETRRNLKITRNAIGHQTHLKLSEQRFSVCLVPGTRVMATNLLGEAFEASLATSSGSVLVGFGEGRNVKVDQDGTQRLIRIQLRRLEMLPSQDADNLCRLLSNAAYTVLAEAYGLAGESCRTLVEDTFTDLCESDQLEIRVTQQLILEDAALMLSQLGLQSDERLGPLIAKQVTYRRLRAERGHNESKFGRHSSWTEDEIDAEQGETNRELRKLLEDEESGGPSRVLKAVRHRIRGHNQYNAAAVPFELFQNADDAYQERAQWFDGPLIDNRFSFVIDADLLAVRHFGRCVNQVPPNADPREHKCSDDLRKMLTLGLSNKDSMGNEKSDIELTGKFGLGFKSVFLVSDRPKLLSGRLACEIVGGMFPRYLNVIEREWFDCYLDDLTPELRREVTVIELPLSRPEEKSDSAAIFERFGKLAHILVVFGQRIRRIEVKDESSGMSYETKWHDEPIAAVPHCFKGTLTPLPKLFANQQSGTESTRTGNDANRVLVVRTTQHGGALLLVHDGRRFQKLPEDVPTLWVTAPTQEALDVGIALNAGFSLDPGRAQLGRESPENDRIAVDLGRELGQRLVALFEHQQRVGWSQFADDIGLDRHAVQYEFWDSLWELLGTGLARLTDESHAAVVLRKVFWDKDNGAARRLYGECQVLPNGLPGDLKSLTSTRDIKFEIRGLLMESKVLEIVIGWNAWNFKGIQQSQCVVRDRVILPLEKLKAVSSSITPLSLADIVKGEVDSPDPINFATAKRLAEVLFNEPCVSREHDENSEWKQLRPILEAIRFPDRTGSLQAAKQLLFGISPQGMNDPALSDEVKLAGFAPSDRVLFHEFLKVESIPLVVRLIRKCRGQHELKIREIAEWAVDASGAEAKKAVEHYLAQGQRRDLLIENLRCDEGRLRHSWLAGLIGKSILQTASEREDAISKTIETYARREARAAQSDEILKRVHDWWLAENGKELLSERKYRLFDPVQHGPLLADFDHDDIEQRKAWMRLFMLGMSHTMGRTSSGQDLGFVVDFCDSKGWLDEFVDPTGDPERWAKILHDYLEPQIEQSVYLHWMRQFVGIYAIAERLDDYVESFLSIGRRTEDFNLHSITCPRTSQDSPVDPPPIERILGMGACFVVRELLRLQVITNRLAWKHAFVPSKRVRSLMQELGCSLTTNSGRSWEWSQELWGFVSDQIGSIADVSFGLAFDLPFQVLSHPNNRQMCEELLEVTLDEDAEENDW